MVGLNASSTELSFQESNINININMSGIGNFSGSWNDLSDVPAGFADGTDDTGAAGSGTTYNLENFTANYIAVNLTCEEITGSSALCDGDDAVSAESSAPYWTWANNESDINASNTAYADWLNNTQQAWVEAQGYNSSLENLGQFNDDVGYYNTEGELTTLLDDNYISFGSDANYFSIANNASGWDMSSADDYSDDNLTTKYPNLDTDSTDDVTTEADPIFAATITSLYELENFTAHYIAVNLTCEEITGSSALCDGDDATGTGESSVPYWTKVNNDTPNWLTQYGAVGFKIENQTYQQESDLTAVLDDNYISISSDGSYWNIVNNDTPNWLTQYAAVGFKLENQTYADEAALTTALDDDYVDVDESPTAADIAGSFSAGLTIGAGKVQDDEVDYTAVTLSDFSNDVNFISNSSPAYISNLTVQNTNTTFGALSIYQKNSSCGCFKFIGGGEICSCT